MLYALVRIWLLAVLVLGAALVLTIAVQAAGRLVRSLRSRSATPSGHQRSHERRRVSSTA